MYETRFGLRQRPFRSMPDTAFYYPATGHEHALAQLLQGIADDEGLLLLTGATGTGKTLLCHCLLERLGPETVSAFLTNCHLRDAASLFQAILFDLSMPYEGRSEQELRLALTDYVLQNCQAGKRTVLLLDEAQLLAPVLLEELRLLGNLEAQSSKAVQIILSAQSGLKQSLNSPELTSFRQRLVVRANLEALDVHEAADYLIHQLRTAGGRPEGIITDEALAVLARSTGGIPRLLNQVAHLALSLAQNMDAALVDVEVALEALSAFGLQEESEPGPALTAREQVRGEGSEQDASEVEEDPDPDNRPRRLYTPPRRSA